MSPTRMLKPLALALAAVIALAAAPASAQDNEIKRLGSYRDWSAYATQQNGGQVCYMVSEPKKEEGNYDRRGEVYAMVTHRPNEGTFDTVSFIIGYPFDEDKPVTVNIDGNKFTLFPHNDTAWAPDKQTDKALVQSMIKGRQMIVKGTSSRGTLTTDTYSLLGFTNAHQTIDKACNASN